jgi:hypothetical protein
LRLAGAAVGRRSADAHLLSVEDDA